RFEQSEKILLSDTALDASRLQQSIILIGSKYYQISGLDIFSKPLSAEDKIDIQFSHRGYFVRRLRRNIVENVAELQVRPEDFDKEHGLVIPSLFPVYLDEHLLVSLQ